MARFLAKKDIYGWIIWFAFIGICYYLGENYWHLRYTGTFLILMALISLLLILGFFLAATAKSD